MRSNIVTNCIIAKGESSDVFDCALLSPHSRFLFKPGRVRRMPIDKGMLVVSHHLSIGRLQQVLSWQKRATSVTYF